ncbi:MAG: glycoside hydrolase family 13 protein [Oscillospiraceae bacterium]|jgi:glycosidase|nr:glycoside hydrolase family 13 protein [Oscillospiraceae bacterium]
MRILFDSKQHKTPFGTLRTGQSCILQVLIPQVCGATGMQLVLEDCEGRETARHAFTPGTFDGQYTPWRCEFTPDACGLYYYWFQIFKSDGSFRLFKQGNDTNMEAGEKWQLSCIPADFTVPAYARGAVMYQIFPDRFAKSGDCDLRDKLQPYWVHQDLRDTPEFRPNAQGEVMNNDFYGGNFAGIREKLPYLQELGVGILYLNPIFMAFSNHRYDTADYKRPDPMLGTAEDFKDLCDRAHELGMRIILDGVFSHTGSNSIYFDAKHCFGNGAVSNPSSPYRQWFQFRNYPDDYESWWGIRTLPCVKELEQSYLDYIIEDEDSVLAHWMKLGADGFRLDVVDELPDEFVSRLKRRLREISPDAFLLGEVWEDASNKRAYGQSRRYFTDAQLDSVMNYPWRSAILNFVLGADDGAAFEQCVMSIAENYPPQVLACVMNPLSTHDKPRALTVLGDSFTGTKEQCAQRFLSQPARELAVSRLHRAAFLQFTLPGMPSIYYGEEAGMEGFDDPFCRRFYPWGAEDLALRAYYAALCKLKNETPALKHGDVFVTEAGQGRIAFDRRTDGQTAHVYINQSPQAWHIPQRGTPCFAQGLGADFTLAPNGFCVLLGTDS